MDRLKGKVAIITGGAKGMGLADAQAFLKEGAKVTIADLDEEAGQKAQADLGEDSLFVKMDVSKEADWQNVFKQTEDKFGPVNVLVNNAAFTFQDNPEDFDLDKWKQLTDVDLGGTLLGMKYAVKAMKDKGGSIVNMSSVGGLVGNFNIISYNGAKWGVRGITKSAALYCARKGYPIRINSVHPGIVHTAMFDADPVFGKRIAKMHPMGRVAKPSEIANMIVFLASDESSFSTGSEFVADGGYSAQ